MKLARAVPSLTAHDERLRSGWPLVASQERPADRATPGRRAVTHTYAAIALYTSGRARLEQGTTQTATAGDLVIVPAGQPHRMLELSGAAYWGLAFCPPCVSADGLAAVLGPIERVRDGGSAVIAVPPSRQAFLESLFRELAETSAWHGSPSEGALAVQRSLLTLILAEVERASALSSPTPVGAGVAADALRFIERNCLRRLTLDEIAQAVGRSPAYVTTALSRATGRSANAWIVAGRMTEARRLLLQADEHVDVIAERVGYADATHFIRMFKREHGETPAAWRALHAARRVTRP